MTSTVCTICSKQLAAAVDAGNAVAWAISDAQKADLTLAAMDGKALTIHGVCRVDFVMASFDGDLDWGYKLKPEVLKAAREAAGLPPLPVVETPKKRPWWRIL